MEADITLTVREEQPVTLEYVEAAIKPEQTKAVTPSYEAQTVLPDSGMTLGQVNVGAIPDPTDIKEISDNGDHDVRRYGTARVNVQPTLQSKTVTPSEQSQTVTPDSGKDGLSAVTVERIPQQYIVPSGNLNITANGTGIDVTSYAAVDVAVPQPSGKITITQNGTDINIAQYATADIAVPIDISGTYFGVRKVRVTYTGAEVTNNAYVSVVNVLKNQLPNEIKNLGYLIAGFEIIADSFEDGDFVAAGGGIDSYGSRAYAWKWTNGEVVRSYSNYWQNVTGNIHSGAVADLYLIAFKEPTRKVMREFEIKNDENR